MPRQDTFWEDADGNRAAIVVNPDGTTISGGGGGGGGAVTVADGADVAQGATTGAAVTTDANGTVQQYLRGLVTQVGAVTASPVANTIGDRLKALLTGIVLAAGSAIIGKVAIDQSIASTALSQFTTGITASTAISAKGAAGNLYALSATNVNVGVRYLQIHNKATAPAAADVPVAVWPIPAGTSTAPGAVSLSVLDFGFAGYRCTTGIAIGISTTQATYTAATAADHIVSGGYV